MRQKRLSLVLAILMVISLALPVSAAVSDSTLDRAIQDNFNMMVQIEPQFGSIGGEWTVMALARSGLPLPEGYLDRYNTHIDRVVAEKGGKLSRNKFTEYSRLIVALGVTGKDVNNVGGHKLIPPLANFDDVIKQGINGPIWALIALDTKKYDMPQIADAAAQNSRERMVNEILSREITTDNGIKGGWALMGNQPDPDITAMALYSLWPYYHTNPRVKEASDRALETLSRIQLSTGGYTTFFDENSESSAQVIIALATMGIDPDKDERFIKYDVNGRANSVVDALMTYKVPGSGFKHVHRETEPNPMATDQAMEALIALKRFRNGQSPLFDYTDLMGGDGTFTDIQGTWAYDLIMETNGYGIAHNSSLFKPYQNVSRAEFAVGLANGLKIQKGQVPYNLPDVSQDAWYRQAIELVASNGIMEGRETGQFDPNGEIIREEAMAMIQRAVQVKTGQAQVDQARIKETLAGFSDGAQVSDWAREAVSYTIQKKIVQGRPEGIAPRGKLTRAESVQIIKNTEDVK